MKPSDDFLAIVDRYQDRIVPRIAEKDGGCFDISLDVDGVSVVCVRARNNEPFMVYRNHRDEAVAMDKRGELVQLPA